MSNELLLSRMGIAFHFAFLTILLALGGRASFVEFYNQNNYIDFMQEVDLSYPEEGHCFDIANWSLPLNFGSIRTDRCLMFYEKPDCTIGSGPRFGQSFKVFQNEPVLDFDLEEYIYPLGARSFRVCSQEMGGGPLVDVAFYGQPQRSGPVVAEYKSMCGCRNIPITLHLGRDHRFSIDNHGNDILLFGEEYCERESILIPAGTSNLSLDTSAGKFDEVLSVRPASSNDCIKLKASISTFHFQNDSDTSLPKEVKFATSTKARNNGASKIIQQYVLSERVVNTVDVTVSDAFTKMDHVDVSAGWENSATFGFWPIVSIKAELKASLNYAYDGSDTESKSDRVVNTTEYSISTTQAVEIPECKECLISSYLRKIENYPLIYTAVALITGTASGVPMTAAEVRQHLPDGSLYVRDVDKFTIETKSSGKVKADCGLEAFISVDCKPIRGCGGENGMSEKNNKVVQYKIPVPIH